MMKHLNNLIHNSDRGAQKKIDEKRMKQFLLFTIIIFSIGLIFKIVGISLATWNYSELIRGRNELASQIKIAGTHSTPDLISGWKAMKDGASDQIVGVAIGCPLIALKILFYLTTIYDVNKSIKRGTSSSEMFSGIMWRFIRLFIGLTIGEAITVWLTERNSVEHSPRVIYSYVSPVLSIGLALLMSIASSKMKIQYKK